MRSDRVRISLGRTINLGNFESYRVDVDLESSVRESEKYKDAFARVEKLVDAQLTAICAPVEEALGKKQRG